MNKEPYLAILAAGMGSRYGSLKQIDKLDEQGHVLIDYSIHDAIEAGFKNIVFIIKKSIEKDFKEIIGDRIAKRVNVKYAYQEVDSLPEGYTYDSNREKPWGTGHCIMQLKGIVDAPFAVINADDYYGKSGFNTLYNYLSNDIKEDEACLVGYRLKNTVSKFGYVTRGVCEVLDNKLSSIREVMKIKVENDNIIYSDDDGSTWNEISGDSLVSMNMWGFPVSVIDMMEQGFCSFLEDNLEKNPLKCEYLIPEVIQDLLKAGKLSVNVFYSDDQWFGVTYKEDREDVIQKLNYLKGKGHYNNL